MCRVLHVKEGTYFAWRKRGDSCRERNNARLLGEIQKIVAESDRTYGSRRVTKQLRADGVWVNRKRIAKIMHLHMIRAYQRSPKAYYPTPTMQGQNLLARQFRPAKANQVWASDITNIPTKQGWLYLAVTIDMFSRRVIGWSMDRARTGQLSVDALMVAIASRRPTEFMHHSDRGTQYTSAEFAALVGKHGGVCSLSRKGNCWDNAVVESFFATLKRELIKGQTFATRDQARAAIFSYIEGWYNRRRLHSTLGYQSPVQFEDKAA